MATYLHPGTMIPLATALAALHVSISAVSWIEQASGVSASLRGVSAVSETVAWASGSAGTVLRTTDGGRTWRLLAVTGEPLDFRDIDAVDEGTAYAMSIGTGPASRVYKTTDGGATWALQFTNPDAQGFFDAMAFWDATHGLVVGDSVGGAFSIFLTADGGTTWTPAPRTGLPPALAGEGAFAASGTNVAVYGANDAWFVTNGAGRSRVLHSGDRGRTWTIAGLPLPAAQSAGVFSVAFRDRMHGVVVGGDYTREAEATNNAAWTSDGGRTWTLVRDRGLSAFRSVVAYSPGTRSSFIAVGPQGADWSDDDGRSWTPIPGPGFHTFGFARRGGVGWAAGSNGRVARWE